VFKTNIDPPWRRVKRKFERVHIIGDKGLVFRPFKDVRRSQKLTLRRFRREPSWARACSIIKSLAAGPDGRCYWWT